MFLGSACLSEGPRLVHAFLNAIHSHLLWDESSITLRFTQKVYYICLSEGPVLAHALLNASYCHLLFNESSTKLPSSHETVFPAAPNSVSSQFSLRKVGTLRTPRPVSFLQIALILNGAAQVFRITHIAQSCPL